MKGPATICVVTGTRAEFGLLAPVMRAIDEHPALTLRVVAGGSHLLQPARTIREVEAAFPVAATVAMQRDDEPRDRDHDALALARGIEGCARAFVEIRPGCVLVLGDRIEAFAAACASSIMGVPLAHVHGGDRAEGIADEAMRHAISKLAHLHFAATAMSGERLVRMGEDRSRVRVVGSPAIDGLRDIAPMGDAEYASLGSPSVILSLHPLGRSDAEERVDTEVLLSFLRGRPTLALMPNHDAGRDGIVRALRASAARGDVTLVEHLPRDRFVAMCARVAAGGGVIVGNSSAGLIECAALPVALACVNIGTRQAGRERPASVVDCPEMQADALSDALARAARVSGAAIAHPYGDGRTGERIASALASIDLTGASLVRKHNSY